MGSGWRQLRDPRRRWERRAVLGFRAIKFLCANIGQSNAARGSAKSQPERPMTEVRAAGGVEGRAASISCVWGKVWASAWKNRLGGFCTSVLSISLKVILTGAKIPSEVPALREDTCLQCVQKSEVTVCFCSAWKHA